jgi:hypothetical protein
MYERIWRAEQRQFLKDTVCRISIAPSHLQCTSKIGTRLVEQHDNDDDVDEIYPQLAALSLSVPQFAAVSNVCWCGTDRCVRYWSDWPTTAATMCIIIIIIMSTTWPLQRWKQEQ